jgi:uncharacterized protein (UPF0261 family)
VLLIEQNLGVALEVADRIGVMVNGRIAHQMPAAQLAPTATCRSGCWACAAATTTARGRTARRPTAPAPAEPSRCSPCAAPHGDGAPSLDDLAPRTCAASTAGTPAAPRRRPRHPARRRRRAAVRPPPSPGGGRGRRPRASVLEFPVAASSGRAAYVAGTFDTKARELFFLRQCLEKLGLRVVTVDLSTSGKPVAGQRAPARGGAPPPGGESAVFSGDRGSAVTAMALAFEHFVRTRRDLGGIISAGGSGGTSLATPACARCHRRAQGDGLHHGQRRHRPYVGPSDICMMYSVTDVQGINRISEKVLANAAHALAGMIAHPPAERRSHQAGARPDDVRRHHALRAGGDQAAAGRLRLPGLPRHRHRRAEHGEARRLGLLAGVIDVSTTEVADEIVGGVLSAGPTRLDVFARHAMPYVGSCGALDMVNFGAWDTVPERFRAAPVPPQPHGDADAHHADECRAIGASSPPSSTPWRPGALPDPEKAASRPSTSPASRSTTPRPTACCSHHRAAVPPGPQRKLLRLPHHINDEAFADALVARLARGRRRLGACRAPATQPTMPRIARQTLLERFRAKIAAGQPIIGGGAGTGLSAKCEEAGGIDLIVIYNSGRYRMAGRGSLAGLLAYGNANEIVCEMAREVLPVVKHTPVLAGVNGTDPFMMPSSSCAG